MRSIQSGLAEGTAAVFTTASSSGRSMLLSHVTSTGVSMLAPTASTVTSLPASEAQQFIAVGSSALPPMPPPARILSTSSPLILDTYSPARLMLRGQLDPEVLKLIPLRSVSLKMRMSPVPLSRRQTVDPDRTLASGKLSRFQVCSRGVPRPLHTREVDRPGCLALLTRSLLWTSTATALVLFLL